MAFAKQSKFKCPTNGCGREAKFVRATVEEFIYAYSVGGEKAAYYIVECAKHGQRLITTDLQPVIHQKRDPNGGVRQRRSLASGKRSRR